MKLPSGTRSGNVARAVNRAYLATSVGSQPRVRVVFPAFEGRKLWIATKPGSAKARQIARNPQVELFFEASGTRPIAHLTVTGTAVIVDDAAEIDRVWRAKLFGYNLEEFWPNGSASGDLILLGITPSRVELGWQPAMWVGQKPQVWKP